MKITYGFIGPRIAQIFSLNNAQILIWPPDYYIHDIVQSCAEHWGGGSEKISIPPPSASQME